jgi:hypothetical protein
MLGPKFTSKISEQLELKLYREYVIKSEARFKFPPSLALVLPSCMKSYVPFCFC